ncbi:hypothetical protein JHK86_049502 [Glycine max]|nr:hypothetical protein JHK86_049502 [Glycine max]
MWKELKVTKRPSFCHKWPISIILAKHCNIVASGNNFLRVVAKNFDVIALLVSNFLILQDTMVAKIRQSATESPNPKPEVGEIDTSPPFQSVKDAVSLFGEGAFSGEKPIFKKAKPYSAERVLAKETQLHVAQKELNKLREQVKNAETTKAQALVELERAKRTVEDLTQKIKVISDSRELAIEATEAAKSQAKQLTEEKYGVPDGTNVAWKEELEAAVKRYASVMTELDAAKQALSKTRQEYDSSLDAKKSAFKLAAEAGDASKENTERASELSKEISAVKESIEQAKLASIVAQQQQTMILAEKDVLRQSYKATLEQSEKKLLALKKEFSPELAKNLEMQLAETMSEIGTLQKEMENKRTSDLDSVKSVTLELDDAKESLQKVADEESSLRSLVESLKVELENVKREHSELQDKESETESIVGNLHVKLRKCKSELEACMAEESKVRGASEEMILTLSQLTSETENARREAEDMKNRTAELKKEVEVTMLALEEAEKNLKVALEEAEAAKAAEKSALDQITILTERTTAARASTSESGAVITISKEEFDSLSHKVEESDKLADMKVAAAKAQVEAVKASENEALKRLETTQKEIEDIKTATQEALKKAEMAEAAKRAVESELRRWREREQKRAAEAASRILAETQVSTESSPQHYRIQKQNPPRTMVEVKKFEKEKVSVSKKTLLPNISGIFQRKKNQVEGGSPSYLPGENPFELYRRKGLCNVNSLDTLLGNASCKLNRGQIGLSEDEQKKKQEQRLQLNGGRNLGGMGAGCCQTDGESCCQDNEDSCCCQNDVLEEMTELSADNKRRENVNVISRINKGKGASLKFSSMPTWLDSWEQEDTYAAFAVVCAAVSVAIAYSCYKQMR